MFPIPTLHDKKNFAQLWDKIFWPIFPILAQIFFIQNCPKKKLHLITFFHLLLKKFRTFSDFTEIYFFEIGWWNNMTIASKPHIPFLWRIFLRLDSNSSCSESFYILTFVPLTLQNIEYLAISKINNKLLSNPKFSKKGTGKNITSKLYLYY